MYLKKIEIQGFKSFANKTEIKFKDDITAIVGPNGSGKSNISDAIRWVLGEQSIKNLRGSKMEDIIFSGTDKRRALGFAEVSIYFNNEDSIIPIEYSEVVITRRVFRSGESEFYINKNSCRLKDIRSILMDTGIGKDGYSIIGQGRIDEILSNKPENRRNIFEEASEIVKYKSKKQETEKRLDKTNINLNRIKDLIHEISSQEKSLKKEAKKSNKFLELYEKLKDLEIKLHTSEIIDLREKIEVNNEEFLKFEEDSKKVQKDINESKIHLENLKEQIDLKEADIEDLREESIKTIKKIENKKNEETILKEKINYFKKDIDRLEMENSKRKDKISNIKNNIILIKEKKEEKTNKYIKLKEQFNLNKEELEEMSNHISNIQEKLDEKNKESIEIHNKLYKLKTELENLESNNLNSQETVNKSKIEKKAIKEDLDKNLEIIKSLNKTRDILKKEVENLRLKKDNLQSKIQKSKEDKSNLDEKIKKLEIKYESTLSKYNLYKSMEENYEGYYRGVKSLIKEVESSQTFKKGYIGIVAELFKVKKEFETAIDISLGSKLQNCVVENEFTAKKMIDFLKKNKLGRVTFLPLDIIKGSTLNIDFKNEDGVIGLGHEVIGYNKNFEEIFKTLLGRTIIVDNLNNGIKLANKYNHRYRIVSLDGDILNPGGALSGGSFKNNNLSIISRKNKIKELEINLKNIKSEITNIKGEKNNTDLKIRSMEKDMENLEIELAKTNEKMQANKDEIQSYENHINIGNIELKKLEEEIYKLETSSKNFYEYKNKYLSEKEELESIVSLLDEEILKEEKDLKSKKDLMVRRQGKLTDLKIEINKLDNKIQNFKDEIQREIDEKENLSLNYEDAKKEIESFHSKIKDNKKIKIEIEKTLENLKAEDENINNNLSNIGNNRKALNKEIQSLDRRLEKLNEDFNRIEQKKNKANLNLEKWEFKIENHRQKVFDDYEINLGRELELNIGEFDLSKSKDIIDKLKSQIKSLGNVNVASIDEYREVKERLVFFNKQHKDLIDGKKDLENIIVDMEKKMRVQFLKSFKEINKNFAEIFSKLFDGGKANLFLEDDKNILEAGVEIEAQPPGKKLQNLNLLSGGEKSLTAVALLFAMLKAKPSPFCVLDEIDAALDDTNINRYTEFLKEFNENTQFILITHRKTTMEIADILYGVTMEEDGISQLISIKLEDDIDGLAS